MRARQFVPTTLLVMLAACGAQSEPPKVDFGDQRLKIESGMYTDDIAYAEMNAVMFVDDFPEDAKRTNGFAYRSHLRGSFELQDGTRARVYIDASADPIIRVELADDSLLFLNDPDEAKTNEYYEQLDARIGGDDTEADAARSADG